MDEFNKHKIAFSVTLLAVLITLHPIIKEYANVGFFTFNYHFTLGFTFNLVATFLGAAVYLMSFRFLTKNNYEILDISINILYSISLAIPLVYLFLYSSASVKHFIITNLHYIPGSYMNALTFMLGIISGLFIQIFIFRKLNKKDAEIKDNEALEKRIDLLLRAERLYEDKSYDLALIEAYRSIETTINARKIFGPYNSRWPVIAMKENLINENLYYKLLNLSRLRNEIIHSAKDVTPEEAREAIQLARQVVKALNL